MYSAVAKKYFSEDQRTTGWYLPRNEAPAEHADAATVPAESTDSQTAENHEQAKVAKSAAAGRAVPSRVGEVELISVWQITSSAAAPPAAKIAPRIVRTKALESIFWFARLV